MGNIGIIYKQHDYQDAFTRGLEQLLDSNGLGVFILVLANATNDATIYDCLVRRLHSRYKRLRETVQSSQAINTETPEDIEVFRQITSLGIDNIQLTRWRNAGPWEVQFNQLRAFRPPRISGDSIESLAVPFDEAAFHFNKPFLRKEIIWEGNLLNKNCRLIYNKFPFANMHGLLVVDPCAEKPQYLHRDDHFYIWRLAEEAAHGNPCIGFGYNSYGAFASVNHQHFQIYVRTEGEYPVESTNWRHNGGALSYPLHCRKFRTPAESWEYIDKLHHENQCYNLLYRPGLIYVLLRPRQGSYKSASWTSGFTWAEAAGHITTFSHKDYSTLDEATIEKEFSMMARK